MTLLLVRLNFEKNKKKEKRAALLLIQALHTKFMTIQ